MFGSRNDDEKVAKRRVWPWGRRDEQGQAEETAEQFSEPVQDDSRPAEQHPEAISEPRVAIDIVHETDASKKAEPSHQGEQAGPAAAVGRTEGRLGLFARMRQKFEKPVEEDAPAETGGECAVTVEQTVVEEREGISKPESDVDKAPAELVATSQEPAPAVVKDESKPVVAFASTPGEKVAVPESAVKVPSEAIQKQPVSEIEAATAEPRDNKFQPSQQQASQNKAGDVSVFGEPVISAAGTEEAPEGSGGGFFAKMRKGLSKTRNVLVEGVTELFVGKKEIDDELLEELETQLLVSDVGVEATTEIIEKLTERVKYRELDNADALIGALKAELRATLEPADKQLIISRQKKPYVILVVGVNGAGKTTTIGKLAGRLQRQNKSVMLAAGDTFRAAAVEQLQAWGERNKIPVVAQHTGADSASVIYDAFEAAKARGADVLIADTAGRLHNKEHLMEELKKVKRVLGKLDGEAPHEVLLVLDAGTGQNALSQAKLFHESVGLTGMALTKLDGTAKGGVIFALSRQMQLPIRFLGVGEQIDDLRPFVASEFVDALFDNSH